MFNSKEKECKSIRERKPERRQWVKPRTMKRAEHQEALEYEKKKNGPINRF